MSEDKKYYNNCIDCGKGISYYSKRCSACNGKNKLKYIDKKIKLDGKESKDKDYLSKKAWREQNKNKDFESKKKWLKSNSEKRKQVCREWDKRNPEKRREMQKRTALRNPEKIKTRNKARYLKKDSKCMFCGSTERLQKHHPDYSRPELIITLCFKCHRKIHNGR